MSPDQIRPILVISLCFVMFLMWEAWQRDYGPRPAPTEMAEGGQTTNPQTLAEGTPPTSADIPQLPTETVIGAPGGVPAPGQVASATAVRVETDVIRAFIDTSGNVIRLELRDYPVAVGDEDSFALMDNQPPEVFVAQTGLVGAADAPSHHEKFTPESSNYELAGGAGSVSVPLRWQSPTGVSVTKTLTFHRGSYLVDIDYHVSNRSDQPWAVRLYSQFQRTEAAPRENMFGTYTYTGGVYSTPEQPYEKFDFSDMASQDLALEVAGGWVAMIQHYFAGAWVPDAKQPQNFYSRQLPGARYNIGLYGPAAAVQPGADAEFSIRLFAGPKLENHLNNAAPGLERTVDYGWLWFIADPLHWLLSKIHGLVGNWGIAIILLTLLIKGAFFQLSAASYKSMARMRKMQPRMMALRERYGDDKQRLNQSMMELYKTEKINPLGGCLPILVQIPVFISLYWVLLESVELRQAPFFFWIDDLSAHDPVFVLPVLMGISMLLQQRLNPTPPDPIQAKVMMALPFVFTFFFLFFPSGLVLYWFVNNVLSIAQQWVITKKIVGPETAPEK